MTRQLRARSSHALVVVGPLAGCLWPTRAEAHLVTTGLGPIYDGIWHVLVSPDDLVPVVAMALLAGMNGPTAGRRSLFALTSAWLVGGLAGFVMEQAPFPAGATALSFLALGGLTALDRPLSAKVVTGLAVSVGLLHGWLNGVALSADAREVTGLVGIGAIGFVLVALVSAFAVSIRPPWARIALRVGGSWVAAMGLLLLGWTLRGT